MTLNVSTYDIDAAVQAYLATNWTYTSIRRINKDDAPALPYIECYTKPGGVFGLEINGVAERVGVFIINIFTANGVGVQQGFSYGSRLEELFWHKELGTGIWCENGSMMPSTEYIGIDAALQACHHKVTIPFSVITENE